MERALRDLGCEVETATTDDAGPGRRWPRPAEAVRENGVVRWYFPKQTEFYKGSLPLWRWLRVHTRCFDVVHLHALFSFSSLAAAQAARAAGVPYVVRPLGTLTRYGLTRRRPGWKRLSLRWFEGPMLRAAAAVHFTSLAEQREAETLGIRMRSRVLPLAIEPAPPGDPGLMSQSYPEVAGKRVLLFLSRLDPKKNPEGLLRGFALCQELWPDTRLVIAGGGSADYVASLRTLATHLRLEDAVVWTGHLEGPLKASALAAAEGFILPSFSENFGLAAVEALAAGLPCLLGHGVALAEEVAAAGAGICLEPEPLAIAGAIRQLLAGEEARRAMAARAGALARERYSVEALGTGLEKLYQEVSATVRRSVT